MLRSPHTLSALFGLSLFTLALPFMGLPFFIPLNEAQLPMPHRLLAPDEDEAALLALPPHRRADAAIMAYTSEGTFETLRPGTNGLFCIADAPDDGRFSVSCHPESMRSYLERARHLSLTEDAATRNERLTKAIRSGTLAIPAGAHSHWISGALNPATGVPDSVTVWSEIALPFATPETTGLETRDAGEAPYLMSEGRYSAHVMIDTRRVAWPFHAAPPPR